ncbi:TetR/AcrR family transcriptional regulator [Lacisediminihabitans profunda]|uniref:TetR/AcrR family transcriptional regulator n=1 Tax=Lacisediminihabitans profunda TaxID=2594790 RepID=A0A5C8ULU6_9MICO|nr:TetR/AcrR family transcriptional regulator [Lacisediminihabitans profunda]TXN29160.1 TetR/AcrR family transcriptional regulator [Lacisediminihabitans profunda]
MAGVKDGRDSRRYTSAIRDDGAKRTRRAILSAARQLILEDGYASASLSRIAAAASVARPTVTARFGSKPALLKALVDEALAGDDEPIPVAERPWFRPVVHSTSVDELSRAYAAVCALVGARTEAIFEVLRRAADSSPELASLWDQVERNRRLGAAMVVRHAVDIGALTASFAERATDALWVYNNPALYRSLVVTCGWSTSDFESWLSRQIAANLVNG